MDDDKMLTIHLEAILLQNGKFSARFEIHEPEGGGKKVIPYVIKSQFDTKAEAVQDAEAQARDQVAQDYDVRTLVRFVRD